MRLWLPAALTGASLLAAGLCLASADVADKPAASLGQTCSESPFFDRYRGIKSIRVDNEGFDLNLVATQHYVDCGAMDSYGTGLQLRFRFQAGKGCSFRDVLVATSDFGQITWGDLVEVFTVDGGWVQLEDPQLSEIVLRSPSGRRAIKLLSNQEGFYYYEAVEPGGRLKDGLQNPDDLEDSSCCWGATQNWTTFEPLREPEAVANTQTLHDLLGPKPWSYSVEKYERPGPECSSFFLFGEELVTYFDQALPSNGGLFLSSNCKAIGKIRSSQAEVQFEISGSGEGWVRGANGGLRLQCDEQCLDIFGPDSGTLISRWLREQR